MFIIQWLKYAEALNAADPDARADAVWIAEEITGVPRAKMRLVERELDAREINEMNAALKRHMAGEPIQYIFNKAPFMGFEFYLDPRALIPRMDTETLVEAALDYMGNRSLDLLDLCAGSGAIGISIKRLLPQTRVTLSDISAGAGEVQRINARVLDVEILEGDMFSAVNDRKFDVITCNPPYIRSGDMDFLQREVLAEPKLALDGGADGLDFYRILSREARARLNAGGRLFMEIGAGQAARVMEMFPITGAISDLNGVPRVVWAEF